MLTILRTLPSLRILSLGTQFPLLKNLRKPWTGVIKGLRNLKKIPVDTGATLGRHCGVFCKRNQALTTYCRESVLYPYIFCKLGYPLMVVRKKQLVGFPSQPRLIAGGYLSGKSTVLSFQCLKSQGIRSNMSISLQIPLLLTAKQGMKIVPPVVPCVTTCIAKESLQPNKQH